MHLFIDTNILLNLYTFPDDTDGVIDDLLNNIGPGKITLHLPKQVENEFERNRESKLHVAVADFQAGKLPSGIPNHMRGTEAAKIYQEAIDGAIAARKQLIGNATSLALQYELPVDKKIIKIFNAATRYEEDDVIFRRALERAQRGNPPGKGEGVGDRYNWETLLEKVPAGDLYIISKDGDYASPLSNLDKTSVRARKYLSEEWFRCKSGGSLHIYTTIKAAIARYKTQVEQALQECTVPPQKLSIPIPPVIQPIPALPEIAQPIRPAPTAGFEVKSTPEEIENARKISNAISYLESSGSFAMTHDAISKLDSHINKFTTSDAARLFTAAVQNEQIGWIISDSDVNEFYLNLANKFLTTLDPSLASQVVDLMGLTPSTDKNI